MVRSSVKLLSGKTGKLSVDAMGRVGWVHLRRMAKAGLQWRGFAARIRAGRTQLSPTLNVCGKRWRNLSASAKREREPPACLHLSTSTDGPRRHGGERAGFGASAVAAKARHNEQPSALNANKAGRPRPPDERFDGWMTSVPLAHLTFGDPRHVPPCRSWTGETIAWVALRRGTANMDELVLAVANSVPTPVLVPSGLLAKQGQRRALITVLLGKPRSLPDSRTKPFADSATKGSVGRGGRNGRQPVEEFLHPPRRERGNAARRRGGKQHGPLGRIHDDGRVLSRSQERRRGDVLAPSSSKTSMWEPMLVGDTMLAYALDGLTKPCRAKIQRLVEARSVFAPIVVLAALLAAAVWWAMAETRSMAPADGHHGAGGRWTIAARARLDGAGGRNGTRCTLRPAHQGHPTLEQAHATSTVVLDKTGTITAGAGATPRRHLG